MKYCSGGGGAEIYLRLKFQAPNSWGASLDAKLNTAQYGVFMYKYVQCFHWTKIEISNTITLNIIFVALFLKCLCKRLGLIHCLNLGSLIRSVPAKLIYHLFKMGFMDPLVTNFCFDFVLIYQYYNV